MKVLLIILIGLLSVNAIAGSMTISWVIPDSSQQASLEVNAESLSMLPQTSYQTFLPWIDGQSTFTGVTLPDLFNAYDLLLPDVITIKALNNYSSKIRKEDIKTYKPIIAYLRDGKVMKVRDKGPYWLIYSLSDYPEIDNSNYYPQMVWQIDSIELDLNEQ